MFLISRSLNWLVLFIYSHSSGLHSHYFTNASKLTLRNLFQIGHHQTAKSSALHMMTSSNGHMFLFTGPLWGEATGHQWISLKLILNKRLSKQSICWWFETQLRPVWRHCNVTHSNSNVFVISSLCCWRKCLESIPNIREYINYHCMIIKQPCVKRIILVIVSNDKCTESYLLRIFTVRRRVVKYFWFCIDLLLLDYFLCLHLACSEYCLYW